MEAKLKAWLDKLDEEEAEQLLTDEIKLSLDEDTAAAIRARVRRQAGFEGSGAGQPPAATIAAATATTEVTTALAAGTTPAEAASTSASATEQRGNRRKRVRARAWLAAAGMAVILAWVSVASLGVDKVTAAIGRWLGFVPGHGIVDERSGIQYALLNPGASDVASDGARLTIQQANASEEWMSVVLLFEPAGAIPLHEMDEAQMREEKQRVLKEAATSPNITLHVGGESYPLQQRLHGAGITLITGIFYVPKGVIAEGGTYTLTKEPDGLEISFQLTALNKYASPEQIGPTVHASGLSITALAERKNDELLVTLYPFTDPFSGYQVTSLTKDPYNLQLEGDMHLVVTSGSQPVQIAYLPPSGPYFGYQRQFAFRLGPEHELQGEMRLQLPAVTLQSEESSRIKLPVPKLGEQALVGKELSFRDSTVTIVAVERVKREPQHGNNAIEELKITMAFTNTQPHYKLNWVYLDGVNTGGFSWEYDEAGQATTYYYSLANYDKSTIEIEVERPQYLLAEELSIKLE